MFRNMKSDFTLMALMLIPIAVAINFIGFQIANVLRLPIFLDVIGTILVGIIAGPWVAIATGLVTNLINAIFNPIYLPYAIVSMAIGLAAGILSKKGMFRNMQRAAISGVIITFVTVITAAPITVLVFGGATANTGSIITATLMASGMQIWSAVFSSTIMVEIADKIVSVLIAYFIVKKMSARYLSKFNYGKNYMKDK